MKSTKYLDQLMSAKNLKNDAALAQYLGLGKSNISQYRSGTRIMDNETCLKVALALEIDPLKVIMAADLDRAERSGQRSLWEVFTSRTALANLAVLFVSVNLFLTPQEVNTAVSIEENATVKNAQTLQPINYAYLKYTAALNRLCWPVAYSPRN